MGHNNSLLMGELISLGLTTFLYGLFFTMFVINVVMTFYLRGPTRRHHMKILPVSFLMFLVATTHVSVLWVRAMQAFIDQRGGSAEAAFYGGLSDAMSVVRVACLLVQSILGDVVIIWRMYVVYNKRFRVVVPAIILVTAYTAVGIVLNIRVQRVNPGTDFFNSSKGLITAYFSMAMSSNIVCSGAIAARIFSTRTSGNVWPYWRIVFIIIESNALYSLGVLAALVTFLIGTSGHYPAVDAIAPLVGIVFCLIAIQIRVHVYATDNSYISTRESSCTGTNGRPLREDNNIIGGECTDKWTRAIPMTIHVSKQTTHVLDCFEDSAGDPEDSSAHSLSAIKTSAT